MCGENIQIYRVHLENGYEAFLLMPLSTQNLPPSSCHHALGRRNYSFPQAAFFRKSVSPNSRRGRGNYDLLYQDSVRKYEDD